MISLIFLGNIKPALHSWDKSYLVMIHQFLLYCWTQFIKILFRIFPLRFMGKYQFVVFFSFFIFLSSPSLTCICRCVPRAGEQGHLACHRLQALQARLGIVCSVCHPCELGQPVGMIPPGLRRMDVGGGHEAYAGPVCSFLIIIFISGYCWLY